MSFRSRRHLTAWLGLFAMWLVVFVPLVSQLAAASSANGAHRAMPMHTHVMHGHVMSMPMPEAAATSAMSMSAMSMSMSMPMPMSHDGGAHSQSDMLAACGYCDLLADHIAIPAPPPLLPPFVLVLAFVVATVLSTRYMPLGAFPSGQPRAPPVFRPSSL